MCGARRLADKDDPARVAAMTFRMAPDPGDDGGEVVDARRPGRGRSQSIIGEDGEKAMCREIATDIAVDEKIADFVAVDEAAAVKEPRSDTRRSGEEYVSQGNSQ